MVQDLKIKLTSLEWWIKFVISVLVLCTMLVGYTKVVWSRLDQHVSEQIDERVESKLKKFQEDFDKENNEKMNQILQTLEVINSTLQSTLDRDEMRIQLLLEKQVEKINDGECDDIQLTELKEVVMYYPSLRDTDPETDIWFGIVKSYYEKRLKEKFTSSSSQ